MVACPRLLAPRAARRIVDGGMRAIGGAILLGLAVWVAGLHVFDLLHFILHGMLRSRWRVLRWLAAPHAMHHRWLDAQLRIHWDRQAANFFGHIVLEYGTQLVFSVTLLFVLPAAAVAVAVACQTIVFAYIASERGLDPNHRPIDVLDAYQPSFLALPAYHALHHVWPDAHYSAYSKLVDWIVGGGTQLRGRRFALWGGDVPFGAALRVQLERAGVAVADLEPGGDGDLEETDVLVIASPDAPRGTLVERFIGATRRRQLPPEVWAVQPDAVDGLARHYHGDPRVIYRALVVPPAVLGDPARAARAAATAMFLVRRGLNFVPTMLGPTALRQLAAFRRTPAEPPDGGPVARHRAELAAVAA